ncbi:MAG: sensor domain-containing diguanylate cyclase, partial [Pseudomonadales bacterium]|nr:sensor domain-containing diguanylate cyclase [Pseudomonadales bacterium]
MPKSILTSLFASVFACWFALASSLALASPTAEVVYHPLESISSYFVDEMGQGKPFLETNPEQMIDRYGFQSMLNVPKNLGYEHSVHWVLIPVHKLQINRQRLFIEYDYPLIDFIDFYTKRGGQAWQLDYETGDMRAFESRVIEHRNFYFPLSADVDYVLLRVQTEGALLIPLAVVNDAYIYGTQNNVTLGYGLFFGALGIMCVYNLFVFFFTREASYFYYVNTLFFLSLYMVAMSGYGYQWLWRENGAWVNEHIQPITVGLTVAFVCLFARDVLNLQIFFPRLAQAFIYLSRFCFAISFLGFFLPFRTLIHLVSLIPIVVIGLVIFAAVSAARANVKAAKLFLVAWLAGLLGAAAFALHQIGLLPYHPLFVHGLKVGVLMNTVILSFSLVSHINFLRVEKQRAEEMAHENYRLALVDGLTGIPNRRAFDHQYRLEYRRSQREKSPLSVLMVDIDYFKRYNDTYGHQQGDSALITVAEILTQVLARGGDAAYRYGGEEFIVLLADTDATGAGHIARQIVAEVEGAKLSHSDSPLKCLTV